MSKQQQQQTAVLKNSATNTTTTTTKLTSLMSMKTTTSAAAAQVEKEEVKATAKYLTSAKTVANQWTKCNDERNIGALNVNRNTTTTTTMAAAAAAATMVISSDDQDDNNDDEFFDATSTPSDFSFNYKMNLESSLEEANMAISYFFNNKFNEARDLMSPFANVSMYHAMGSVMFSFLEAILTFEQQHIARAAEELKKCMHVCQMHRRKFTITQTIGHKFKKINYAQLTDIEAHAELCFAEALLLKAILTFIEDETLKSLIQGGIKIRQCFNSFKECTQILHQRKWQSEISRLHFESGVRMGIGTFNLMISLLPGSVIKLLEFIGFSGNKQSGLDDLMVGYEIKGLRQILCAMTLLGYHLIVCFVLSHEEGDLILCNRILNEQLTKFPDSVWFLFFKGRLEFMCGNLDEAKIWYTKSWQSQNLWPQFHHLSFWELLWLNCLQLNWREACIYAGYMVERSKWSRTIYSYQQASIMLMLKYSDANSLTIDEEETIVKLFRAAPTYKQRIAGKSLPMEKFIIRKVERYFSQNQQLCLPAIEIMYLWNTFKVLGKKLNLAEGIFHIIQRQYNEIINAYEQEEKFELNKLWWKSYEYDNRALCLLLLGACYRQMKKPILALQNLDECIALEDNLREDTYIVAYASVERGLIFAEQNNIPLAVTTLEEAKKKYTGFLLESRLHFRIHTALMTLKEKNLK